jgi:hypothetical protein
VIKGGEMSCKNCEESPLYGAYYRWKTANVEIVACKEHWLEIRDALNRAQTHYQDDGK